MTEQSVEMSPGVLAPDVGEGEAIVTGPRPTDEKLDNPKAFVMFATPSYSQTVTLDYLRSAIKTEWAMKGTNIAWGWLQVGGDAYLSKVRNHLATMFYSQYPDATHLFFIDDDLSWDPASIVRMIESDKDVIAGVYPKKQDIPSWPAQFQLDADTKQFIRDGNLIKARAVPTGFLCIKRHVWEKLAAVSGRYREPHPDGKMHARINFFQMGLHQLPDAEWGDWWGEDFALCEQLTRMGIDIWVDPDIEFTHRGQKAWRGNLSETIAAYEAGQVQMAEADQTNSAAA